MLQLVFACSPTRNVKGETEYAFGLDDGLPWKHISQDFKNFKSRTMGTTLIMGAKTFQSLPGKLEGRKHMVLHTPGRSVAVTKRGDQADQYVMPERVKDYIKFHPEENFSVIGGAKLLQEFAPIADKIIISKIIKSHYVNSTVKLPIEFIMNIHRGGNKELKMQENHFWQIDELTQLFETVYA
ncbi:dihydrofolate reductase [Erwinia phage FBB1]|nr:dihydrofolate reductase [Erwinia phage FBB1]